MNLKKMKMLMPYPCPQRYILKNSNEKYASYSNASKNQMWFLKELRPTQHWYMPWQTCIMPF